MKKVKIMGSLLTRDRFRESVFHRDNHRCVICDSPGQDAHHIMERRLFNDGGYYLNNGATLCGTCHLRAESTELTCEEIRQAAGITKVVLPESLYKDCRYDKWGNPYLPNGQRLRGDLFYDESVQKIIVGDFTKYVKYPRTYHLPNSHPSKDDRQIKNLDNFIGKEVVITEKMDGENTTMYYDFVHARSVNSDNHPSRSWVKSFHASNVAYQIDEDFRICGENLFARHSIPYHDLASYFLGFSVWDESNLCLSWDDTLAYFEIFDIKSVPVLFQGILEDDNIRRYTKDIEDNPKEHEGYVIRLANEFSYGAFKDSIAKYVRPNHVQTTHHWKREILRKNSLKIPKTA